MILDKRKEYKAAHNFFFQIKDKSCFQMISFCNPTIEVMMVENYKFSDDFPMEKWNMWIEQGIIKIVPTQPILCSIAL